MSELGNEGGFAGEGDASLGPVGDSSSPAHQPADTAAAAPILGGAGERTGAAGDSTMSAVAKKGRVPWGTIAGLSGAGVAIALLVTMMLHNHKGAEKPPAPQLARAASAPPDLIAIKKPPPPAPTPQVRPMPVMRQQLAPAKPQMTRAEELAEKSQHAPLMAVISGGPAPPRAANQPVKSAPRDNDTALSRSLGTTPILKVKARSLGDPTLRLSAGTLIPCILDTAIDTTTAGFVRCHVENDVYSANGTVVLLDAGTVVLGEYDSGLKQGQERIGVVWNRAETPNSVAIDLGSPATDALGRGGVDGQIETYFWTRFGAAIMFSLLSDAGAVARAWAQSQLSQSNPNNAYVYSNVGGTTQQSAQQVGAATLRQTLSIPPVLKKNQGERVNVFVRNDLDFSGVYSVERR